MSGLPTLSTTERLIIELLAAHEELFGLRMVELSEGRLKRGTVYVTLGRMQEKGYLESRQEPLPEGAIGLPRRLYRPTGLAMRILAAWKAAERMYVTGTNPQEAGWRSPLARSPSHRGGSTRLRCVGCWSR